MSFLSIRKSNSRKGDNGKVLVIGGSKDYTGAVYLAAMAALRTGVDIVTVAAPEQVAWALNIMSPNLITRKLEGDYLNWDNLKEVIELSEGFDSVLIGNGMTDYPECLGFSKEVIENIENPKVIDADALKNIDMNEVTNSIFTPHEKEFEHMTGENLPEKIHDRTEIVKHKITNNNVFLLKGHIDIITSKNKTILNETGNPGMTIGGTGDILAGITAGFLAQSKDLEQSAYSAAYINGKAGEHLYRKKGYGFTADDILDVIPEIIKKTKWI